jgi:hypothetical protein
MRENPTKSYNIRQEGLTMQIIILSAPQGGNINFPNKHHKFKPKYIILWLKFIYFLKKFSVANLG